MATVFYPYDSGERIGPWAKDRPKNRQSETTLASGFKADKQTDQHGSRSLPASLSCTNCRWAGFIRAGQLFTKVYIWIMPSVGIGFINLCYHSSTCIDTMGIETQGLLASLGASESLLGILLLAGALLLFRATVFGQSLGHIPVVGEELGKSKRIQAYKIGEKDVLADGYKKVKNNRPLRHCLSKVHSAHSSNQSFAWRHQRVNHLLPSMPIEI